MLDLGPTLNERGYIRADIVKIAGNGGGAQALCQQHVENGSSTLCVNRQASGMPEMWRLAAGLGHDYDAALLSPLQ
ncbi:unnamed protein product (plasmid) [Mycetohabitans rhizoxinica HKI 454]|uniref:Uncharacterized protein n=1 Tax=Mycetohabitans rhizoxinica (strain DSM 19002 / CIP 109453 / HKI 454) TaxID=882378 RepID=E5AW47_MYCRK|nr:MULTISPECIES: TAL effector repeat-containing protein [Mycetohabitans]MCG1048745.1 TAL effector repeat-containing protein [Mycetohabitans sp. B6]CBW77349.1 unnamed protein product [Mycetohabitans rhizoxinica HKI 454]